MVERASMTTYTPGFRCRGSQTLSRSERRGRAGCSSQTEGAWSPATQRRGNVRGTPERQEGGNQSGCLTFTQVKQPNLFDEH